MKKTTTHNPICQSINITPLLTNNRQGAKIIFNAPALEMKVEQDYSLTALQLGKEIIQALKDSNSGS